MTIIELQLIIKQLFLPTFQRWEIAINPLEFNYETNINKIFDGEIADHLDAVEIRMEIEKRFNIRLDLIVSKDEYHNPPPSFVCDKFGDFVNGIAFLLNKEYPQLIVNEYLSVDVDKKGYFNVKLYNCEGAIQSSDGFLIKPGGIYLLITNKWNSILYEFESLLNSKNLKEKDLQEFLEKYPEILGGETYDTIIPQAIIEKNTNEIWKADFILKPFDQYEFCKILEVKNTNIANYRTSIDRHHLFSSKLYNAVSQFKDYS